MAKKKTEKSTIKAEAVEKEEDLTFGSYTILREIRVRLHGIDLNGERFEVFHTLKEPPEDIWISYMSASQASLTGIGSAIKRNLATYFDSKSDEDKGKHVIENMETDILSKMGEHSSKLALQLWEQSAVKVEGYKEDGKDLMEFEDWKKRVPFIHRVTVMNAFTKLMNVSQGEIKK